MDAKSGEMTHSNGTDSFLLVLDMTSSLRFEAKREIMRKTVIPSILKNFIGRNEIIVSFAVVTGSISFGVYCRVLRSFKGKVGAADEGISTEIDSFLAKEIDKIVDFGPSGDSLTGQFGIGATVEAFCTALIHFNSTDRNHLVLLPTSLGTEIIPNFRTCSDDQLFHATLPQLLSLLRGKRVSLSIVAPGLSDSTVVEQFIVFKCNEKIGHGPKALQDSLGPDWVVRLSALLVGNDERVAVGIDENELLNQTLLKLAQMPSDERVAALKVLLDPASTNYSPSFRQKFAAAVKMRLQESNGINLTHSAPASPRVFHPNNPINSNGNNSHSGSIINNAISALGSNLNNTSNNHNSNNNNLAMGNNSFQSLQTTIPQQKSMHIRRGSEDLAPSFWSGCVRFTEKQQSFIFRVQFVAVDSQPPLPKASLENWPMELNLTGLLDSKKESIQAGLSVGYAFRVNVANADAPIASYLMNRMCQGPSPSKQAHLQSGHLACFRISQDVLVMLRVLSVEDLQFVGYLIDRRFPKTNLSPAAQSASNAINSLTALKTPISSTLSAGIDSLSLNSANNTANNSVNNSVNNFNPLSNRRPSLPNFDNKMISSFSTKSSVKPISSTNYITYSQFIQHNHPPNNNINNNMNNNTNNNVTPSSNTTTILHLSAQTSPAKIPVISNAVPSGNQLLTDPQAILQKLRPAVPRPVDQIPAPMLQPNEATSAASTSSASVSVDDQQLDQSFIDSWLN